MTLNRRRFLSGLASLAFMGPLASIARPKHACGGVVERSSYEDVWREQIHIDVVRLREIRLNDVSVVQSPTDDRCRYDEAVNGVVG